MRKICTVDECNEYQYGLGYCSKHYYKYKRYSDPLYVKEKSLKNKCRVGGCERTDLASEYCYMHYLRIRKHGDIQKRKNFHGLAKTKEYSVWSHMIQRCYNSNVERYSRYGGRGITVCDRWKYSFTNFYEDMGTKPFPEAQIDRIDNDGNYEPSNCRWVTRSENCLNRSTSKKNKTI